MGICCGRHLDIISQRSQTSYITSFNAVVSLGAQFGGVLPTTLAKTSAKQMCPQSSCVFYLQAQTAKDALTYTPDEPRLF